MEAALNELTGAFQAEVGQRSLRLCQRSPTDLYWAGEQNVGDINVSRLGDSTNPEHYSIHTYWWRHSIRVHTDWWHHSIHTETDPFFLWDVPRTFYT